MMELPELLAIGMTERSGTLLLCEGEFNAWLPIGDFPGCTEWLEISWRPENWPSLNVQTVKTTEAELAKHINANMGGFLIISKNLCGLNTVEDDPDLPERIAETD
jgi:hypothetical protein